MTYTIKLSKFEGPFDLLLFFIERDELDINDIPISKITNDFLEYIRHIESLDLEVASEFILVAATLMRIKAKMLIPRKPLDEFGNEIDPRTELVQKLLEYKQFKALLPDFEKLEYDRSLKNVRGNIALEIKKIAEKTLIDEELENLSLYNLMKAFQNVLLKFEDQTDRTVHEIVTFSYNVDDQQDYISAKFVNKKKLTFDDLFNSLESRVHAIVTFLALLEMLNLQLLQIEQGEGMNNFYITHLEQS